MKLLFIGATCSCIHLIPRAIGINFHGAYLQKTKNFIYLMADRFGYTDKMDQYKIAYVQVNDLFPQTVFCKYKTVHMGNYVNNWTFICNVSANFTAEQLFYAAWYVAN